MSTITPGATITTYTAAGSGSDPWSVSHTVDIGCNYLLAKLFKGPTATTVPLSVKFNGLDMTFLGNVVNGTGEAVRLYGYANPDTSGPHNFVVDWSGSERGGLELLNFSGVDTTAPAGTVATATGTGTAPSVVVSSAIGELVVDAMACTNDATTATVGSGQTQTANFTGSSGASGIRCAGSTEDGAASVTMRWTLGSSRAWCAIGIPLKPASFNALTDLRIRWP